MAGKYVNNTGNPATPVKLTSDVQQRKQRSQHKVIDHNPNNSYKTTKKFTGSYTEVNP